MIKVADLLNRPIDIGEEVLLDAPAYYDFLIAIREEVAQLQELLFNQRLNTYHRKYIQELLTNAEHLEGYLKKSFVVPLVKLWEMQEVVERREVVSPMKWSRPSEQ